MPDEELEQEKTGEEEVDTPKMSKSEYNRWYYINYRKKGIRKGRRKAKPKAKKPRKTSKPKMLQEQKDKLKAEKAQIQADTKAQREALSAVLKDKIANIRARMKGMDKDSPMKERLKAHIKEIQEKGKEIRAKITEDNQAKKLAAENRERAAAGMPPKAPPAKTKEPKPSTTKLKDEYADMIPGRK